VAKFGAVLPLVIWQYSTKVYGKTSDFSHQFASSRALEIKVKHTT